MPSVRRFRALATSLALLCAGACALPTPTARGSADYGSKAAHTAEEVRSAVETTIVALEAKADDHVPDTTLDVFVTEAEGDADRAASTFASIDPPSASKEDLALRDRTIDLVDGAVDALEEVRLDVRLGRAADAPRHRDDLEHVADDLEAFADEVGGS
jgi:hypothetical protein